MSEEIENISTQYIGKKGEFMDSTMRIDQIHGWKRVATIEDEETFERNQAKADKEMKARMKSMKLAAKVILRGRFYQQFPEFAGLLDDC